MRKTKETISCSTVGPVSQVCFNLNRIRLIRKKTLKDHYSQGGLERLILSVLHPLICLSKHYLPPMSHLPSQQHLDFLSFPSLSCISLSPGERPTENLISLSGKLHGLVFCLIV